MTESMFTHMDILMQSSTGWKFNPETKHLTHNNGICLKIEGSYGIVDNITPIAIPENIDAIALARNIREATEHYGKLTQELKNLLSMDCQKDPI